TSFGDDAALAPALTRSSTAPRLRLCTTSECPAVTRFFAIGRPMMPSPMNPIVCAMAPPSEDDCAAESLVKIDFSSARRREVAQPDREGQGGLLRTPATHVCRTRIDASAAGAQSSGFDDKTSKSARLPASRLPASPSMPAARAAPSVYASSATATETASSGAATWPSRLVRVTAAAMPASGAFEPHGKSDENAWYTPARR